MKKIILLATLLMTLSKTTIIAQVTSQSLTKDEALVIQAANWVETTDLDKELEKRKEINSIVLKWYIDTITLNMSLVEKLSTINEGNSEFLMIFFAGYSRYFIENKKNITNLAATKAGLISVMKVYKKGIGVTKSQEIEKLIKLTDENKLEDYIKTNFD